MSKRRMLIAMGAAVLVASPISGRGGVATSGGRFDLVCSGMQERWTGGAADPWSERFRVDLRSARWCRGTCGAPASIGSVGPDEIVIHDSRAATGGPAETELTLSRTDGELTERVRMGSARQWTVVARGFCTRARFGGFGKPKF